MKLTINYKQRAAKVLDFSLEEVEEYAKRVKGHLNKCTLEHDQLTVNMIIQSVFIIKDIQEKQLKRKASELKVQNPIIRKYQKEIKELNHLGLGSNRISKEIKLKYKANVSASTIYRYLRGLDNG